MSVSLAHNVIKSFNLSNKELKELSKGLSQMASPKYQSELEWAKNDFKARLKESSKQHINN